MNEGPGNWSKAGAGEAVPCQIQQQAGLKLEICTHEYNDVMLNGETDNLVNLEEYALEVEKRYLLECYTVLSHT